MNHLVNNGFKLIRANAPEILTAVGVGGVVSTAILAAKATLAMEKKIDSDMRFTEGTVVYEPVAKERRKQMLKLVWKDFIPPVASGAVTIAAIIMSHKAGSRRTAAAVTAYSLTEKAFSEFREKAAESIGEGKVRRMHDDLAQDKVSANPPKEILVVGKGNVLCMDTRSVRYFRSSMEELKRAENDINFQINHERYVSLSEFYAEVGLPITKESVYVGWDLNRGLMELDISATIADNDEPCLVIDFNYCHPIHDEATSDSPVCEW